MDKKKILKQIKEGSFSLENASEEIKADKEIVLVSVKQDPWSLEYADASLKKDKDVVMAAIKENGRVLEEADESLKKNKDIVLIAVKQEGSALLYADASLKKDRDVVLAAVKQDGHALEHADASLKKDKDVVMVAVEQTELALEYADESFKKKEAGGVSPYVFVGPELTYYYETIKKQELSSIKKIKNRLLQFIETADSDRTSSPAMGMLSNEKGNSLIKHPNSFVEDAGGNNVSVKIKNTGRLIEKPKKDEVVFIFSYQYISSQYNFTPREQKKGMLINIKSFNNEAVVEPGDNPDFEFECESADEASETYLQILCDDTQFDSSIDDKEDIINQFADYLLKK